MADKPTFGRRNTARAGGPPAFGASGPYARREAQPAMRVREAAHEATVERLRETGATAALVGDVVGFCGLIVVFLASVFWPADPAGLDILKGRIWIPGVLDHAAAFTDPQLSDRVVFASLTEISAGNLGLPLLFILGVVAIFRRRWLLVGLVAGFFLFPLPLVGLSFPAGLPLAVLLGMITAISRVRLKGVGRVVFIVAAFLLWPLVAVGLLMLIPSARVGEEARYATVAFAELNANQGLPSVDTKPSGKPIVRVSTLAGIAAPDASQQAAKAFAMAQEHALRGDADKAATSLAEARGGGYPTNRFERRIATAIEDFRTASGAQGAAARGAILSGFRTRLMAAWVIMWIGLAIGLAAPFGDIVATAIRRRLGRIEAARAKLDGRIATGAPLLVPAGSAAVPPPILHSIAASDADKVMAAMSGRIRLYRDAAIVLGWTALICLAAWWRFHLPAAGDNAAFDEVALSGWTYSLGVDTGLLTGNEGASLFSGLFATGFGLSTLLGLLPLVLVFSSRYRAVGLAGLLVASLASPAAHLAQMRTPANPVPVQAMTGEIRQALARVADSGTDRGGSEKIGPVVSPVTGQTVKVHSSMIVDASTANYVLAQIAYLEDRPEDAARFISRGIVPGSLGGVFDLQRLDLMKEWVAARGFPLAPGFADSGLDKPMSYARNAGRLFLGVSIAAFVPFLVSLLLLAVADRRRGRIGRLVQMRRQMPAPSGV